MKTIRPPKGHKSTWQFTCNGCEAVLEAERSDGMIVHDPAPRDGPAIVFTCPHCCKQTWLRLK
jgi:hypothetical protein